MAGYNGYSMSNNAVSAYRSGQMPKTKWTKIAILLAIADTLNRCETCRDDEEESCECDRNEYNMYGEAFAVWVGLDEEQSASLSNLTKQQLFDKYMCVTSWHHTSKKYNRTDFYGVDETKFVCHYDSYQLREMSENNSPDLVKKPKNG